MKKQNIKEYIETLKDIVGEGSPKGTYGISFEHWKQILDHIDELREVIEELFKKNKILGECVISLQEENGRLFEGTTVLNNKIIDLVREKEDYKTRNEKAIEYINNLRDESAERQGFYNCFPDDLYIADIEELLEILKGSDNSE